MDQSDKDKIIKNIVILSTKINLDILVTVLINREVIDREFFERIKSHPQYSSVRERNQEFFLRYVKRGPDAFRILVESLKETGHINEAQRLESTERNRASVSSLESPESETTNSSSSNGSGGNQFTSESPSSSSSGSNGVRAAGFDPAAVHWANRVEPLSPESLPVRRLSDLTMGDLPPLEIIVRPSTMYNQGKNNIEDAYPMMSNPRGFALIVNNIDFLGDPNAKRIGAEVDSEHLDKLLQGLGFKTTVLRNVKRDELLDLDTGIITKFIDQFDKKSVDCCVVAMMSHGNEESIRTHDPEKGNDSRYNHWHLYEDITRRFNNHNCASLTDKPKIFIVQSCRGDLKDRGVRRTQTDGKILSQLAAGVPETPKFSPVYPSAARPTNTDMLICYSTVPGFVSNRDTERGTWYIQCLCEIFMEFAHDTEIHAMLQKVGRRMGTISSEYGEKQMCSFKNIGFNRDLFFNPGLYASTVESATQSNEAMQLP